MKNNITYYRHETNSHNHWKFRTLRRKYGWAGEGRFWALNNIIADSDYCQLNVNDSSKIEALSCDIDLTVDDFKAFIAYLISIRLVKQEGDFVTTEITQEILVEVSKKREYQRGWARKLKNDEGNESTGTTETGIESEASFDNLAVPNDKGEMAKTSNLNIENDILNIENAKLNIEKQQSKVKESKVKERKEKPNTVEKQNFKQIFEQFWESYDKKLGKDKCYALFMKIPFQELPKLIDHVPKYVESTPDKKFRKNPETYLRNKSWHDEIVIEKPKVPNASGKKRGLDMDELAKSRREAGFGDDDIIMRYDPNPNNDFDLYKHSNEFTKFEVITGENDGNNGKKN